MGMKIDGQIDLGVISPVVDGGGVRDWCDLFAVKTEGRKCYYVHALCV